MAGMFSLNSIYAIICGQFMIALIMDITAIQDLEFRKKIGDEAVLAALNDPGLLTQQIGLGEITDPAHPCMRESVDAV